jgi:transcriptional regulator with PAS, ATPase and Fis domain
MLNEDWNNYTRETMQEVVDTMPWSVSIYDQDGRIVMVNRKLCSNVKAKPEEWIGKTAQQLKDEGYIDRTIVTEAMETRKKSYGTTRSRTGVEGLSVCQPVFAKNGDIKFFVVSSPVLKDLEEIGAIIQAQQHQADLYVREIEYLRNMMFLNPDGIFESPCMRTILQTARKISRMDCTVLITGESGVGKEVVAKTIHHNSMRKTDPLFPLTSRRSPRASWNRSCTAIQGEPSPGRSRKGKSGFSRSPTGERSFWMR